MGDLREFEQGFDHLLYLNLLGFAVTDNGALDLQCRIFKDRQTMIDSCQEGGAACVSEFEGGQSVLGKKYLLNCDHSWGIFLDDLTKTIVDQLEAVSKNHVGTGMDAAIVNMMEAVSLFLYDAVTGDTTPRVNP